MSELHSRRLVILDRDGVINHDSDAYIRSPEEWEPIDGSVEAMAALSRAGYSIAVATNQSGLARGYFTEITLANMHSLMCALVEEQGGHIDAICYCPHGPDEGCRCRKPAPGLLEQISRELEMPVTGAWYVGDTDKDVELAKVMRCKPILVRTGKGALTELRLSEADRLVVPVFNDLAGASSFILEQDGCSFGDRQ